MKRTRFAAIALMPVLSACESAPQGVSASSARGHFAAAGELQLAVVHGRLVDAREAAQLIASESAAADQTSSQLAAVRVAAERVARAGDLGEAAGRLGRLGRACGACHEATGAELHFVAEGPPADDASLPSHMRRYAWATARLWDGLVGRDDISWQAGARTLATTRLDLVPTVRDKPNADVIGLVEDLRERASVALLAATPDHTLYAQMMTACVGCHDLTRLQPIARR